jgi:integrase
VSGTVTRRCHCRDPITKKELGTTCPDRKQSKHGEWEYRDRLDTAKGRRAYRRGGFTRKADAEQHAHHVRTLIALARDDDRDRRRIGDYLFTFRRGATLPPPDEVRRRLALAGDLGQSQTCASWFDYWLDSRKQARESTIEGYRSHVQLYLTPFFGDIPLDRLRTEHIQEMFETFGEWNAEIVEAHAEGRTPMCEGDVRKRVQVIGNSTQRRIYATLRSALNVAWKMRRIPENPALFVELPPERNAEAVVWSPEQVNHFLDFIVGNELEAMFRIILIHGPRRGEIVGARWAGLDEETGNLTLRRTLLSLSGRIVESTPKTKAGKRVLHLDRDSLRLLREIRAEQERIDDEGGGRDDDDLIFCHSDGTPWRPDTVSRRWREAVKAAGLPPLRLHDGRHTAATLAMEAGVDIKVVSRRMGHSKTSFTQDAYQHVRKPVLDEATEKVVSLLDERRKRRAG